MILERIERPSDIKKLNKKELNILAREIRDFLIEKISVTGGHLAGNLGVVELTMAMHIAFDLPKDKIIWDVGHQSYTHKILSGRKNAFDNLRKFGGISGFPKTSESKFDVFNTGHSSTSLSAGLGMAFGRDIKGENYRVISVIGDGALTGGMAYEALNNAVQIKTNFIMVLNDNDMSISKNVGGMNEYLNSIRTADGYTNLKKMVNNSLERLPYIGKPIIKSIKQTKNGIKQILIPGMLFENMGITYLGPVDGHNITALLRVFEEAKKVEGSVLVHVLTKKGKGYTPAEKHPENFHGIGAFDIANGIPKSVSKKPTYTDVFSKNIVELATENKNIVAITAAMPEGCGLLEFRDKFPRRFFDVGIAEQHAVTSAAGLAAAGLTPVVCIYSSFLQRGFDQIVHDVCLQNLHVVFAIDRAGLVGADGETHQGIFDVSFLTCIPNMTLLAPKNAKELKSALKFAIDFDGPVAVRYPRGIAYDSLNEFESKIEFGKGEMLFEESDIALFAIGSMVSTAKNLREKLKSRGFNVSIANARFFKPIDFELVDKLCKNHKLIVTMEESVINGSMGEKIKAYIKDRDCSTDVLNIALPDGYVEHGDVSLLRKKLEIDSDSVLKKVLDRYEKIKDEG